MSEHFLSLTDLDIVYNVMSEHFLSLTDLDTVYNVMSEHFWSLTDLDIVYNVMSEHLSQCTDSRHCLQCYVRTFLVTYRLSYVSSKVMSEHFLSLTDLDIVNI